jgi:Ca2+-binding RTX toxin-like protein
VFAGAGIVSVNAGQTTNDTIIGGTGALTVNAGSAINLLAFGPLTGSPGLDFIGGSSAATVVGQAGNDSISAGTASLDVFLTPNETLAASTAGAGGTPTIFGNSNVVVNYTGSAGNLLFVGFIGNETLNGSGSSTNNTVFGGIDSTAGNSLVGGSGNDVFVSGAGADTMTGGVGSNTFEFIGANLAGSAQTDVVNNFLGGNNNLAAFFGVTTVSSASAAGNTTLTLSDNTKVEFIGVSSVSQLSGHIFEG